MKVKKILFLAVAMLLCGIALADGGESVQPYPNFGLPRVEEMMFLVLQIGVILFAAKIGGSIASLFKMPSILGELGAGILIGPWALGGIGFCPDMFNGVFRDGLFHGAALRSLAAEGQTFDATSPALYGIATLASVILLFLSGLETNLKMFLKYSFVGSLVGLGGVIFSFFFGDLCTIYFLPHFFHGVPWIDALRTMVENGHISEAMMQSGPLYMGIMSTATSVGITARILSEKKKMDSEEGVTIMAGAVIDDVLGLIVLAIGNGIIAANVEAAKSGAAAGVNWEEIGFVALKAFGVWLGGTLIGVLFARRISWVLKLVKDPKVIGTLAFGLAMIVAGFFESMGLAMIIGAYVMGLSLSRTDIKHLIQENLEPVYTFLVPIFFCVMGMMVDVSALCSKPVLYFGAIYTGLAILAKILGCMIPSLFCGFNLLGGLRIGAGMVPRGEVALIIAGLGLSKGYLSPEIFGIGIMMTLLTTVVAPPALVALFLPKKRGVYHAKKSMDNSREVVYDLPSANIASIMIGKLANEFRNDGFFVTMLGNDGKIWEITKDAMEISVVQNDKSIKVECTEDEESVVNQVWMEVVSEMNELAHELTKPIQNRKQIKNIIESNETNDKVKGIVSQIRNFTLIPDLKASNKEEAIKTMLSMINSKNGSQISNIEEAYKSVMEREEAMSTGLDHGIAVPHGRTSTVREIVGAIALVHNKEGSTIEDYETIDHSAVQIIVLTLAPESANTPYLQFLASISKALRCNNGYLKLIECHNEEEMKNFFKNI